MKEYSVSDFFELIPNYVFEIAEKLQGYNFEAYLVGGSIRDVLLGKRPDDYDIATNAYPEDIKKIFPKSISVGEQFGTIVVVGEDQHGERFDIEVTTYRSEADYVGGRWPTKVEFSKTIEEDLMRRDFTINAIALNLQEFYDDRGLEQMPPIKDLLVDPFEGLIDLEGEVIRAVREPVERFSEDGLRSVRGCRLAAQLEFKVEPKTFQAMKETVHVTKMVSIERFRDELVKMLKKAPKPSIGLTLMREAGILELFIPELLEGIGIEQPRFHVEDVFEHSIRTLDYAEDRVKLAALFHDIGKPRTMSVDEKGVHFYGHDVVGAEMTEEIMKRLRFSNAEIDRTKSLVRWHMFYYPSADWRKEKSIPEELEDPNEPTSRQHGWSDAAIRRLIQNVGGEEAIDDLMRLRIADATANPKSDFNPKEIDALSKRISEVRAKEMVLKISDLDINGKDLMDNFNLEPGEEIGKTLNYLLDKVIEEPLLNKKVDLLRLAKEKLSN